ncbi:MAG: hypothetical protein GC129_01220 [Proteobacteria bacterium]|nr:hypothetical protein [Pseudomonadota bacterium]
MSNSTPALPSLTFALTDDGKPAVVVEGELAVFWPEARLSHADWPAGLAVHINKEGQLAIEGEGKPGTYCSRLFPGMVTTVKPQANSHFSHAEAPKFPGPPRRYVGLHIIVGQTNFDCAVEMALSHAGVTRDAYYA